jgi:hypothetical protein
MAAEDAEEGAPVVSRHMLAELGVRQAAELAVE